MGAFLTVVVALLLLAGPSIAAIEVNKAALEAEIAAAIATGVDAKTAAHNAISKAVEQAFNAAKQNDPQFAASIDTITAEIIGAFGSLDIPGLDPLEVFAAACEGVRTATGLENTAMVEQGIRKAMPVVQTIVSERLGRTVDFTPALEAYEEAPPDETPPPEVEAYEPADPSATDLIREVTAEPPIVDRAPISPI